MCLLCLGFRAAAQTLIERGFCDFSYRYNVNCGKPSATGSNVERFVMGPNFNNGFGFGAHAGGYVIKAPALGFAARYTFNIFPGSVESTNEKMSKIFPDLEFKVINKNWYMRVAQVGILYSIHKEKWAVDMELLYGRSTLSIPSLLIDGFRDEKHYAYIRRQGRDVAFNTVTPVLGFRRILPEKVYFFAHVEFDAAVRMDDDLWYEVFPNQESFDPSPTQKWALFNHLYLPAATVGIGFNIL